MLLRRWPLVAFVIIFGNFFSRCDFLGNSAEKLALSRTPGGSMLETLEIKLDYLASQITRVISMISRLSLLTVLTVVDRNKSVKIRAR